MLRLSTFALFALVLCCRREDAASADEQPAKKKKAKDAPSLLDRYPVRAKVTYTARDDDNGKVTVTKREERWVKTASDPPTWMVHVHDVGSTEPDLVTRYRLLDGALVYDQFGVGDDLSDITPPKVTLPRDVHVGAKWSSKHERAGKRDQRSCEVLAYGDCDDGIVLRCITKHANGNVITVSNRYCGGQGYVGGDSTVERPDGTTLKSAEEDVHASD